MSEVRHTPGPWTATDQGLGPRGKSLGICISDFRGFPLFFMPLGTDRNVRNAQLVAAAPDLLESLKEIVELTDRKTDIWDKAHAAIAKAEGRKS